MRPIPPTLLHGRTILIGEDSPALHYVLTAVLQHAGATVCVARTTAEALALLHTGAIDLALLDVQSASLDGAALWHALHDGVAAPIPTVVVSGDGETYHLRSAYPQTPILSTICDIHDLLTVIAAQCVLPRDRGGTPQVCLN